jgi:F-type H+-transporting ATPase subunit c
MKNISTKLVVVMATLVACAPAFAQEAAAGAASSNMGFGLRSVGAALAIGMAALGGALGQGRATASALDGIARNPAASGKILIPMVLGLALIESLVIYALIIALKMS